jgi:hypothetical protein
MSADYDPAADGNVFEWILAEAARRRAAATTANSLTRDTRRAQDHEAMRQFDRKRPRGSKKSSEVAKQLLPEACATP